MQVYNGKKIIITKIIVLDTILEKAVLKAMVQFIPLGNEFVEEVKIQLDDMTGKENLYPNKQKVINILDKFEKIN